MSKIQCMCCGSIRYVDQPSPSKDEVGAAMCFKCGEVTICKIYATENDTMNEPEEQFIIDFKASNKFVKDNVMCYFYHNTSNCTNCPKRNTCISKEKQ